MMCRVGLRGIRTTATAAQPRDKIRIIRYDVWKCLRISFISTRLKGLLIADSFIHKHKRMNPEQS